MAVRYRVGRIPVFEVGEGGFKANVQSPFQLWGSDFSARGLWGRPSLLYLGPCFSYRYIYKAKRAKIFVLRKESPLIRIVRCARRAPEWP